MSLITETHAVNKFLLPRGRLSRTGLKCVSVKDQYGAHLAVCSGVATEHVVELRKCHCELYVT